MGRHLYKTTFMGFPTTNCFAMPSLGLLGYFLVFLGPLYIFWPHWAGNVFNVLLEI